MYGYFDYVGVIEELFEMWDVLVYIYEQEFLYVMGKVDYLFVRFDVKKGFVVKLLLLFLCYVICILFVQILFLDGIVLFFEEWKWVYMFGYMFGYIFFFW